MDDGRWTMITFHVLRSAVHHPLSTVHRPSSTFHSYGFAVGVGAALKTSVSCDCSLSISVSIFRPGVWSISVRNLANRSLALIRLGSQDSWFGRSGYFSISSATLQSTL